jgi:hypothetical protein
VGAGVPWDGGVAPGAIPDGTVAGLGLVTWVVLGSWAFLGWRTVAVEERAGVGGWKVRGCGQPGAPRHEVGYAPPGGVGPGPGGFGAPANGSTANGSAPNGSAPVGSAPVGSAPDDPDSGGASPSRRSVGVPK